MKTSSILAATMVDNFEDIANYPCNISADTGNQFYQAKVRFRDYVGYRHPLTYDEWMTEPDDYKAVLLYIQFYDQIILAWNKTRRQYTDINDCVSEILQYLHKNVAKISADGKRYTPNYIYRVAFNCLSCISWDDPDLNRRCRVYQNECSNLVGYGDDELDLFNLMVEPEDEYISSDDRRKQLLIHTLIWDEVEDMGQKAKYVVAKLLGEKSYTPKELNSVSEEETALIIEELRYRLEKFLIK